jgi:hypothetical protein
MPGLLRPGGVGRSSSPAKGWSVAGAHSRHPAVGEPAEQGAKRRLGRLGLADEGVTEVLEPKGEEEQTGEPFRGPGIARPGERGEASTEVAEGRCGSKVAGPWGRRAQPPGEGRGKQPAKARGLTPPAKAGAGPGQRAEGPVARAGPAGRRPQPRRTAGPRPAAGPALAATRRQAQSATRRETVPGTLSHRWQRWAKAPERFR